MTACHPHEPSLPPARSGLPQMGLKNADTSCQAQRHGLPSDLFTCIPHRVCLCPCGPAKSHSLSLSGPDGPLPFLSCHPRCHRPLLIPGSILLLGALILTLWCWVLASPQSALTEPSLALGLFTNSCLDLHELLYPSIPFIHTSIRHSSPVLEILPLQRVREQSKG